MSQDINLSGRESLSIRKYLTGQLAAFFAGMPPVHLIGENSAPTVRPFHGDKRQRKSRRLNFTAYRLRSGQKASGAIHTEDHPPLIGIQSRTMNLVLIAGAP